MKYYAYIGTYSVRGSKGIYLAEVDGNTGEMRILDEYEAYNPSYLAISGDRKYLYCVLEAREIDGRYGGAAASYKIKEDYTLELVSKAYTGGTDPCHLTADKDDKRLFVANYSDGKLTVFPLEDGVIVNKPVIVGHKGYGPNKERQEGPHAHCVALEKGERRLCVVDLGIDKIIFYKIENNSINEDSAFVTEPGAGPRHVVFSQDGRYAWVVCELSSEIYAFDLRSASRVGIYKTLPDNFSGMNTCAAIRLSPDGKFIYASNRGDDSIAVFRIKEDSAGLILAGIYPTKGKTPRDFAFSPDGRFLYAANQDSDSIEVFSVQDGILEHTGKSVKIPSPTCILFLDNNGLQ